MYVLRTGGGGGISTDDVLDLDLVVWWANLKKFFLDDHMSRLALHMIYVF